MFSGLYCCSRIFSEDRYMYVYFYVHIATEIVRKNLLLRAWVPYYIVSLLFTLSLIFAFNWSNLTTLETHHLMFKNSVLLGVVDLLIRALRCV